MEPLQSLHQFVDYNRSPKGGLVSIYYADVETIFDFPFFLISDGASGFIFNDNIEFYSNYDWMRVRVLPHNKFGWKYTSKKRNQGTLYTIECGGTLSHISTAIIKELHKMTAREFVLRVKDADSQELVLGDLDLPFTFSWNYDGGNEAAQAKTINIKWTAQLREPPIGSPV